MRKLVLILIMTLVVGFSSFADEYQVPYGEGQAIVTIDMRGDMSDSEYGLAISGILNSGLVSEFKPSKQQYELVHELIYSNYSIKEGDVFYVQVSCLPRTYHVIFFQGKDDNKWVFLYAN